MMKAVQTVSGVAAPLLSPNIDTEVIIRIPRLMEFDKGQLGPYLFEPLRVNADGSRNAGFILEQPAFRQAAILLAGDNFGCGSSREGAVWALNDAGIRCVIAPSFGDIFAQNCLQNGVLAVTLPADTLAAIAAEIDAAAPRPMTVDLIECRIVTPAGRRVAFTIDAEHRKMLLEGRDEIDLTRQLDHLITAHQARQRATAPWIEPPRQASPPRVLIMAGDGIGPEVIAQARRVIDWFVTRRGLAVDLEEELYGLSALNAHGAVMRPEAWDLVDRADAIVFGASGGPDYERIDRALWLPDRLLQMRQRLDLYENRRPVQAFDVLAATSTLRAEVIGGTEMMIVRELTGGLYFSDPRGEQVTADGGSRTVNTMAYAPAQVERIAHSALRLARSRRRRLCSVDKANVLEVSQLWRAVVTRVHAEHYPDVELSHMYVDNAAMQLVRDPKQFDVIVTENLFGDILSDCAAMVAGSIGMLPSASIGPVKANGRRTALYEPIHGSAPDIAGRGVANPLGTIMSFAMCLEITFDLPEAADLLTRAVARALSEGARTADLVEAGHVAVSTSAMGDAVLAALDALTVAQDVAMAG